MYLDNPLDKFQSYSVHYVLLACRSTSVASVFTTEDPEEMRGSLLAIENTRRLGDPVVYKDSRSDVYLVLDTRRFSQFQVENLKYDVYINGLHTGASTSNLAADLSMTILDSVGLSFANYMQWLMDQQMKTNYDGLVFLLRTIFVGHNADGTSETIQAETIPMHLNRMDINLDYAKGAYDLEFMPNMNFNVKKHARFLTVSTATTYHTEGSNTVEAMINSFEKELNRKSKLYYEKTQEVLKQAGVQRNLGRRVEYMITVPKHWLGWEISGSSPGATIETLYKAQADAEKSKASATGQVKDSYTGVATGTSIPEALEAIFRQVPNIARLGNFKQAKAEDTAVTFFKHIVGITSDDERFVVHVDVVEFIVPNVVVTQARAGSSTASSNDDLYTTRTENGITRREPKKFIQWDYIFTGKNKDILNFDMKIQDFQFLLASNLRVGDNALRGVVDESGQIPNEETAKAEELLYTREYDPLIMPLDTAAALSNFSNYKTLLKTRAAAQDDIKQYQKYQQNLSMFYAGSPITAALTIKGNPDIMHQFNIGKVLPHTKAEGISAADKASYREKLEGEILKSNPTLAQSGGAFVQTKALSDRSYATTPAFAHITIKMPNTDFRDGSVIPGDYAVSALSDNYYVIFKVTNIIQAGVFTQELELYSHNIFGKSKITKE